MNVSAQNVPWWRMAGVTFCGILVFLSLGLSVHAEEEFIPHSPIEILSDTGFTAGNGVIAGTGTSDDPYLIMGNDESVHHRSVSCLWGDLYGD
jgi:hypothetical protein